MMNRAALIGPAIRTSPHRGRLPFRNAYGWGIRRIRRSWLTPPPLPSIGEVEARIRNRPSLLDSVTPEQIAIWKSLDEWGAICGDPNGPKRAY
jgi:hypothetical protein